MTDNPDEARNIGVIAGRDDKGHPLTKEQVEERTAKKLEADAERSEKVKQQLKKESDEASKAAEAQVKADEEFLKRQKDAAVSKEAVHQSGAKAPQNQAHK